MITTTTMASRNELTYPPSVHLSSSESGLAKSSDPEAQPIRSQPAPVPAMSPTLAGQTSGPAQRLRGGCIPCPDGSICYIIPIPCICC
ncbi:hypothetical protein C8Q73DRAFT_702074 [Cubamyces lactineus]|nr:hypothetical protein C8Q73DRAFT_702074 [Cubamyces lactineus]